MKNDDGYVINKRQQDAVAAVAAELLKNCKLDYYSSEGRIFVYYHGPKRFNIIEQDIHAIQVKEVSHY